MPLRRLERFYRSMKKLERNPLGFAVVMSGIGERDWRNKVSDCSEKPSFFKKRLLINPGVKLI